MSRSRFSLSRRAVLRGSVGTGVACVGLPLLEAMLNTNGDALAGGTPLPRQLVVYFIGNGFRLDQLEPATTGASFDLTPELNPLMGVEAYTKVVTGLQNWCAYQVTHHEGMTAFNGYTMAELSGLYSKAGGPTIDQLVADHIEASSDPSPLIRSVQIGISRRTSIMDSGTTMFAVSHRSTNEPLFPKFNPQEIFQLLFGEFEDKPDDGELRLAIIDSVREDANKLRARLGSVDRERLDAHLDGLAQLEEKIKTLPPVCQPPEMPSQTNPEGVQNEPLTDVNEVMAELLVQALKCDVTRVASVQFIGGAAETVYTEIGQNNAHHNNTHNGGAQAEVHEGVVYAMGQVATLANKMRETIDPTGKNLLESGLIMVGSDCSEGLTHSVSRQPYILIGNLRDSLVGKYHYQSVPKSGNDGSLTASGNTSDVLMTVLKAFNPEATSVGDMTARNLQGGWYGTGNPPNQAATGSNKVIDELLGPAFGG
ncbi:MAG: DUF1552 domain-containing protein [Polyangiaceae bacterium]|nr:DUF1552 domain-containing protein [Polyangiaceae bacterium]